MRVEIPFMKKFLRNHKRGAPGFVGAIGSHLIEILDDDPSIRIILSLTNANATDYSSFSQGAPRYCGPSKRMILKNFSNEALVVFHTLVLNQKYHTCEMKLFVNGSKINSNELLHGAVKLAASRWQELYVNNQTYNLHKLSKLLPREIEARLSLPKN